MIRFLLGLVLGAAGAGITWAATTDPSWTAAIGITIAVAIWFAEFILDDLL